MLPEVGSIKRKINLPSVLFPDPDFAHQSQRFARLDIERHIVNRAHLAASAFSSQRRFALRIYFRQVADFDNCHCYSRF